MALLSGPYVCLYVRLCARWSSPYSYRRMRGGDNFCAWFVVSTWANSVSRKYGSPNVLLWAHYHLGVASVRRSISMLSTTTTEYAPLTLISRLPRSLLSSPYVWLQSLCEYVALFLPAVRCWPAAIAAWTIHIHIEMDYQLF